MAPVICTSTAAAESEEDRPRITPSSDYFCEEAQARVTPSSDYFCEEAQARVTPSSDYFRTPRSSSAPAEPSSSLELSSNPWSSQTSPSRPGSRSAILNPNSKGVPIITLKSRERLRHPSGGRDHEAMDEEVWHLRRALLEKDMELRRRKAQAANLEAENRKLAKDNEQTTGPVEDPNSNQQVPWSGSPCKLRTKLASMKGMLEEAYNTCELQSIELYTLRRDVCLTRTRELQVERNVFATEVRRLQDVVRKLKLANGRIGHESSMIGRLKAKNHHLEVMNLRLSSCLSASLSRTSSAPRTPRIQEPERDALVRNSFGGFDYIQQQENAFNIRSSTSPATCLPR